MSKKEVEKEDYLTPFEEINKFPPESFNQRLQVVKEDPLQEGSDKNDHPLLTLELLEKDESVQGLKFILNSVGIRLDSPMTYLVQTVCSYYYNRGTKITVKELIDLKNNVLNLNQKEDGKGM